MRTPRQNVAIFVQALLEADFHEVSYPGERMEAVQALRDARMGSV